MDFKAVAQKYNDYVIEMRRHFHAHPEVSEHEFETSRRVKEELDKMGVAWRPCGLQTGVLAKIDGKGPGKTVLLRADMDALTVVEETGCEFASQNPGVMHACGHDCHTAILLTAAQILKDHKDEFNGTVLLAFQPAEEVATGAKGMIADGALEGVDAAFGIHVWSEVPSGMFAVRSGAAMASADRFIIDVVGKGGHGAQPNLSVDAVVVASSIVQNLQTIVSREVAPVDPAVVTVGVLEAGTRWNVIAGTAHLEGTTRCFSNEVWNHFPEAIERIATQTAAAMNATIKFENQRLVPPTINDPKVCAVARAAGRKVMGEDAWFDFPLTTGGEDFAFYQQHVPGAAAFLGVANEACDAVWPHHHGKFKVDESALINGAMWHAQFALDFLNQE